ncbi:MAG TPA: tail fiber protein [Allosphingosinicella sp.]|jgi:microcystin-dependent protein
MAEPFLSEIRMMSFNFAPKGWAQCNGQFLPINQNQALFSLLGTTYGGDGRTTFALPDLRGRVPIHEGSGHTLGEKAGTESVTISQAQMPQHIHFLQGSSANATTPLPTGGVLARGTTAVGGNPINYYTSNVSNVVTMNPASVTNVGGSQPHNNMMPYLTICFCIALQGIFPSPN